MPKPKIPLVPSGAAAVGQEGSQAAPAPPLRVITDPNLGRGGSYTIDPVTRQRQLNQRTNPCKTCQA